MENEKRKAKALAVSGEHPAIKSRHKRTEQRVIDEDLRVHIFRTNQSSNWYVQFNVNGGGQRKKSLKTHSVKEAERRAWEIVTKLRSGEIGPRAVRSVTVRDAVAKFLADKERIGRRRGTLATYRGQLTQLVEFLEADGVMRLDRVNPDHLQAFESRLLERGVSVPKDVVTGRRATKNAKTTVFEKAKLVKILFKWAVRKRLLMENPVSGHDLPSKGQSQSYCFTPDEVKAICQNADPFFGRVFQFLAMTGLRQGELTWLTKDDVNLEKRFIHVRAKTFARENLRWQPKSDNRTVPLCPEAAEIASAMISDYPSGRWLFPAPMATGVLDDRLRACRLCAQLKRARKAAGVAKGKVHGFRHFFVSTMANKNVSPFQVMKIVGHKSLDIILTYYHVSDDELRNAVDGVDFRGLLKTSEDQK